jgi:hypothetical protein
MNMIGKFATSLVAVAAFSAIIYASTGSDSMNPAQLITAAAAADASQFSEVNAVQEPSPASDPLNSKETPQEKVKDLQYN